VGNDGRVVGRPATEPGRPICPGSVVGRCWSDGRDKPDVDKPGVGAGLVAPPTWGRVMPSPGRGAEPPGRRPGFGAGRDIAPDGNDGRAPPERLGRDMLGRDRPDACPPGRAMPLGIWGRVCGRACGMAGRCGIGRACGRGICGICGRGIPPAGRAMPPAGRAIPPAGRAMPPAGLPPPGRASAWSESAPIPRTTRENTGKAADVRMDGLERRRRRSGRAFTWPPQDGAACGRSSPRSPVPRRRRRSDRWRG